MMVTLSNATMMPPQKTTPPFAHYMIPLSNILRYLSISSSPQATSLLFSKLSWVALSISTSSIRFTHGTSGLPFSSITLCFTITGMQEGDYSGWYIINSELASLHLYGNLKPSGKEAALSNFANAKQMCFIFQTGKCPMCCGFPLYFIIYAPYQTPSLESHC